MKNIFLSDIHIGDDSVTNLYRTAVDQANLKHILSYVQTNSTQIKDLVVLGDWLDLWMYPASVVPPTFIQIIDANPQIFTRQSDNSGDFVSCLDSIQGTIHYINGNHDITVTSDEINDYFQIASISKKQIICSKSYNRGNIHGEHGHKYSMVCKPYENEPLPLGYFITRAGMQILVNTKKPTKQARLYAQKSLPPIDVLGIQELISYNNLTFAQAMLTSQANQMNMSLNELIFTMPDGSTINASDVADKFPMLSVNDNEFLRTDVGGSLDITATHLLMHSDYKMIIFGHTHIKELKKYCLPLPNGTSSNCVSNGAYANIGFLCANEPNQNGIPVSSFVEIDDTNTISLIKLDHDTGVFTVDKTLSL